MGMKPIFSRAMVSPCAARGIVPRRPRPGSLTATAPLITVAAPSGFEARPGDAEARRTAGCRYAPRLRPSAPSAGRICGQCGLVIDNPGGAHADREGLQRVEG